MPNQLSAQLGQATGEIPLHECSVCNLDQLFVGALPNASNEVDSAKAARRHHEEESAFTHETTSEQFSFFPTAVSLLVASGSFLM